ncbi:TadE family protein [Lachnospiraceae bacterium 62-35]
MKKWKEEKGVIMVEASIYFPIVIFTVFAMIYYGMVKYQESILTFQVQKIATEGAREIAFPGYETFSGDGSLISAAVDFKTSTDFDSSVENYYDIYTKQLYREWQFNYDEYKGKIERDLEELMNQKTFLSGIDVEVHAEVHNQVIARQLEVTASYGLKSPKFLAYVGVPMDLKLRTVVKRSASNPVDLVRNTDLAFDLIDFLLEQFNLKDKVDTFLKKVEDIKDKIL